MGFNAMISLGVSHFGVVQTVLPHKIEYLYFWPNRFEQKPNRTELATGLNRTEPQKSKFTQNPWFGTNFENRSGFPVPSLRSAAQEAASVLLQEAQAQTAKVEEDLAEAREALAQQEAARALLQEAQAQTAKVEQDLAAALDALAQRSDAQAQLERERDALRREAAAQEGRAAGLAAAREMEAARLADAEAS